MKIVRLRTHVYVESPIMPGGKDHFLDIEGEATSHGMLIQVPTTRNPPAYKDIPLELLIPWTNIKEVVRVREEKLNKDAKKAA